MTWQLERTDQDRFVRNPLRQVVTQLRFSPILKITQNIADFQDRVRSVFPLFRTKAEREIKAALGGEFEVKEEQYFQFLSESKSDILSVSNSQLTLETSSYSHHEDFFERFELALSALRDLFSPVRVTRLGLRYVNLIYRAKIAAELGEELVWSSLIDERFLYLPSHVLELEGSSYANEVVAGVPESGSLFLRYGLDSHDDRFHFDMDRFLEGDVSLDKVPTNLAQFSDDCYSLFRSARGAALRRWMELDNLKETQHAN